MANVTITDLPVVSTLLGNAVLPVVQYDITSQVAVSNIVALATGGNISSTGNITAVAFFGNGAGLTGLPASYGNTDVSTYLSSGSDLAGVNTQGPVVTTSGFRGIGSQLTGLTGANVTGTVPSANVANTALAVAVANVTGIGNIATINLNGNANTVLVGNGSWLPGIGNVTFINLNSNASTYLNGGGAWTVPYSNTTVSAYLASGSDSSNIVTTGNVIGTTLYANSANAIVIGSLGQSNVALNMPNECALRNYGNNTTNNSMYFDVNVGNTNSGQFQFRSTNAFTQYASINSYGISLPTRPACRVYGTVTATNIPTGSQIGNSTGVTVDYNIGNCFDSSTGVFTAPVAGLYMSQGTIRIGTTVGLCQVGLLKNNNNTGANTVGFWEMSNTVPVGHMAINGTARLAAGDTLSLKVMNGNVQFDNNDSWTVTFIG